MGKENEMTVEIPKEFSEQLNSVAEKVKTLDAMQTKTEEIEGAVNTVREDIDGKIKAQNTKLDSIEEKLNLVSVQSPGKKSDPNRGFKNHIDFFNAVIMSGMNDNRLDKMPENLREMYNAVGSDESRVASNPDGGFLIPPAFLPGIMSLDPQGLQVDTGALTRKVPMDADTVYVNARVDKDHSDSVSGGFRVYRREETASVTASKATYEQIKLQANSLMGLSYATEEILARSPVSFASLIQGGFSDERISKLNYERVWGTGVGEFLGVMNSGALVTVAKEGSQTADTIVGENLVKMRARAWRYGESVWMANHDCLERLMDSHISGTNVDRFLFAPGNGVDKPDTLMGRPVILDENMATIGDLGDILLVNWREYLEGQLGGINFAESVHVRFVNNERAFRFTIYNDGQPWWRSALTPKKSTTTLGPFIALAERA